jgi:hypothetical protein
VTTSDSPGPGQRPTVAVFDLDGVIADLRHRLHNVERRPKDWTRFFAAAATDDVLPEGRSAVDVAATAHRIVYLTGRPVSYRALTESWLRHHELPDGELHMRPVRDRRPSRLYKVEVLQRLASSALIVMVVDDDPAVVAAVKAVGLPVSLADWMTLPSSPSQTSLFEAQEDDGRT